MYATCSSPARPALLNRTNVNGEDEDFELKNATCHQISERKRQFEELESVEESKKRVKVDKSIDTDSSDDEDAPVVYVPHPWRRRLVGTRALVAGAAPTYQMPTRKFIGSIANQDLDSLYQRISSFDASNTAILRVIPQNRHIQDMLCGG